MTQRLRPSLNSPSKRNLSLFLAKPIFAWVSTPAHSQGHISTTAHPFPPGVCVLGLAARALSWFDRVPSNLHFFKLSHFLVLPTHSLWSFLPSGSPWPLSLFLGRHTKGWMCYIYLLVAKKEDGTGIFVFPSFLLYLKCLLSKRQNLFPRHHEF